MTDDQAALLDQDEEDILAPKISDEALEAVVNPAVAATMGPGSCYVPGGMIC